MDHTRVVHEAHRNSGAHETLGGPADALIEVADTVTEMRKIKHAYDRGIGAKKGIEY